MGDGGSFDDYFATRNELECEIKDEFMKKKFVSDRMSAFACFDNIQCTLDSGGCLPS